MKRNIAILVSCLAVAAVIWMSADPVGYKAAVSLLGHRVHEGVAHTWNEFWDFARPLMFAVIQLFIVFVGFKMILKSFGMGGGSSGGKGKK